MPVSVARFAVLDAPCCVWTPIPLERNIAFLRGLDAGCYSYVARAHEDRLNEPEDSHHAAAALRLAFCQGVENLFALIGAAVQAPHCVYGWLLRYTMKDLREVTRRIDSGGPLQRLLPPGPLSWDSISSSVHGIAGVPSDVSSAVQRGFAEAWARLANEFLSPDHHDEYNSLKHGARARLGGFSLTLRSQTSSGVVDPDKPGVHLPGSEFGSRFPVLSQLRGHQHDIQRHNYCVGTCASNWAPYFFCGVLRLVADSINNVVSYLLVQNGVPGTECKLRYPEDLREFESLWTPTFAVRGKREQPASDVAGIRPLTREEILAVYSNHDAELQPPGSR